MFDILLFMAKNPCDDIMVLRIFYIIKKIMEIVFILVPIILIVLVMLDFAKNVIANKEDDMNKNKSLAIKRIIYAIVIFFVPTIVNIFMSAMGDLGIDYSKCMAVSLDSINSQLLNAKNSCTASDMEWNETLGECIKKRSYTVIDPNIVTTPGHGGLTAKDDSSRDISNNDNTTTIDSVDASDIKYYNQCDPAWTSTGFCNKSSDMCNNGCGAASIAMIAATYGNDSSVNPVNVRDYLCSNGLHSSGGMLYSPFTNGNLLKHYGINGSELISANESKNYDESKANAIKDAVDHGKGVILLIPGHYVVIGQNKKCSSDEVFMYDPANNADSKCYTMKSVWNKTWNRKNRCIGGNKKCGWRRAWVYTKG